ncbi:general stress protein [Pseudogracilibacillus sp. ICA-222130]|uniref:general stress protein n=1 Tax=Pseudogracilibacillus sp. ICA-222130 TaxID=3134655 RepID=UPI0030BD495B
MKPKVKEFQDDQDVIQEVEKQLNDGVSKENLYIITHDDDRTKRIAKKVNANVIGLEEEGMKVAMENMFNKKGDELRNKLEVIGFSEDEAAKLEEKLDHGKVLLISTNEK